MSYRRPAVFTSVHENDEAALTPEISRLDKQVRLLRIRDDKGAYLVDVFFRESQTLIEFSEELSRQVAELKEMEGAYDA